MKKWVNQGFHWFYGQRYKRFEHFAQHPKRVQLNVFNQLIEATKHTEWGQKHDYRNIKTPEDFARRVPVQDYESLKPYIERMMLGEKDILWSGRVTRYSKSSGTTNDRSKFIPISDQNLKKNHIRGTYDTMTSLYNLRPDARQFECKTLLMGGSIEPYDQYPATRRGDISAIMMDNMPWIAKPFFTPDFETALMHDFEKKIERMAEITSQEDLVMAGGVPTWTLVLFRKILEITGKKNILEVWPNFQAYVHGGVSFTPYREQFEKYLPSKDITYMEVYNASEGFFAVQTDLATEDMLLLLDNGVYYEFLPISEWHKEKPQAIPLWEVEPGKDYAMLISTNGGLWRYNIGDTVTFTSTKPYKIKITGRTKQFVNAFGEEVMVDNTDAAIAKTCRQTGVSVLDYTVAPIYLEGANKGGHEWLIEFDDVPRDVDEFATLLDNNLQEINSDYAAKRYRDMALTRLRLRPLPRSTFDNWMRSKGKYGGQSKVPRLSNNRRLVEEILDFFDGEKVFIS